MTAGSAVAVSFKMRSAILLGGHRPAAALWWDDKTRRFVTSTYYSPPAWLASIPAEIPPGPWTPRDPALLARETGGPDDAPGEGAYDGLGATFPMENGRQGPEVRAGRGCAGACAGAGGGATLGRHQAADCWR